MTPEQLYASLSTKFNLINFIDLAELSASAGSAIDFFKSNYKPEYQVDDRIVIYSDQSIDDALLSHIYDVANFIDVSNWFVLFCTSTDISQQLSRVCETASADPVPFQNLVVELSHTNNLSTQYHLPETMCAIPWSNLEIQSSGTIAPCCMFRGSVGHIQKDTLTDVFYGTQMKNLRTAFLNGEKPGGCKNCWDKESKGLTSIRQHNAKRLKEKFVTDFLYNPTISHLDIKFQNTCNFKCRICNAESSSLYAAEQAKYAGIPLAPQLKWSEDPSFIEQINKLLPNITNIDMFGGEPFLIKKFAETLKTAVDQGYAKNIRLHYNSNGSTWPEHLIEYWPHFKCVDIHFSIDAIGKRAELQRGGHWPDIEANILRIKNLNFQNMSLSIMPAISAMSIYYIDEVVDWAKKHDFQIFVSHVINPEGFSLNSLTTEARDLILKKHRNNPWPEMKKIIEFLESSEVSDGKKFCEQTQWFDSVRQENFSESHPEIAKALGYVYNKNL